MNFRDPDELTALAGEYVLGTLSAEERAELERELRTNATLRRAVHDWQDRSSVGFWQSLTGLAAAAAVVLGWIAFVGRPVDTGVRYTAVLQAPDSKDAGWLVEADARKYVRLTPLVRTSVPSDRALQFWTKPEGAAGPTSLGLVPPDRVTVVPASALPALGERQLFEITLEPEKGSPIGRPTGPILYVGTAVAIQ
jgi:anti-sigma-K factor RskA